MGVIRRLRLGSTLRRIADSDDEAAADEAAADEANQEGETGEWWIDLTATKHKTSRCTSFFVVQKSTKVAPMVLQLHNATPHLTQSTGRR